MPKRNNIWLLGSLLVMIAVLVVLILFGNSDSHISVDKNLFKVADQTKIDRIVLKNQDEQIELHFDGARWMVNDSFEADRQLIQVVFATLLQTEPRRPVAQRLRDSIHQKITQSGIEVKLFEGKDLMKSYFAGGNARKSETYYELSGDDSPYVVMIPGYRVYIAAIFELKAHEWRDKRIFNFNWQNFKRLSSSFPKNEEENFVVAFQGKFFALEGNPASDTTKLNDYLDAISLLQVVRYLPAGESAEYDSLLGTGPDRSIVVTDIANRSYRLDLYPPISREGAILGRLHDGQAVLIRQEDLIRVDRKKSHFKQ